MKKIILWIVIAVLAIGAIVGVTFWIVSATKKADDDNPNNTSHVVRMLEDKYNTGEKIIFDLDVFSDLEFKSLSYKLDNAASVTFTGTETGESVDHEEYKKDLGKYFIDTGAQIIETEGMSEGYHTVVFYGTIADGTVYQINNTPYIVQIIAVQAA